MVSHHLQSDMHCIHVFEPLANMFLPIIMDLLQTSGKQSKFEPTLRTVTGLWLVRGHQFVGNLAGYSVSDVVATLDALCNGRFKQQY